MYIYVIAMDSYWGEFKVYLGSSWVNDLFKSFLFTNERDAVFIAENTFSNFDKWYIHKMPASSLRNESERNLNKVLSNIVYNPDDSQSTEAYKVFEEKWIKFLSGEDIDSVEMFKENIKVDVLSDESISRSFLLE